MTPEEAQAVARAVAGADGNCHVCARDIAADLIKTVPGPDWAQLVAAEHWSWSSESDYAAEYAESIRAQARGE